MVNNVNKYNEYNNIKKNKKQEKKYKVYINTIILEQNIMIIVYAFENIYQIYIFI